MKTTVSKMVEGIVYSSAQFHELASEKENPDNEYSRFKYLILAIPQKDIDALRDAIALRADDMEPEDFDEDGIAKQIDDDEDVSNFLKRFITVSREQDTYRITVEFVVEADSERDAEEQVGNLISGRADYTMTDTVLDD